MYAILAQATPPWNFVWGAACRMWPPASTSSIDGVLAFYSLPAPLWDSFCNAVGDPGNDVRVLASMPSTMVAESVAACRMTNGRRLTAVEARASFHNGVHLFDSWTTLGGPKVVRACGVLYMFTSKCASRRNGVHLFDISTSKSRPRMVCFGTFYFQMCFAPHLCALFPHRNVQKVSDPDVF